MRLSDIEIAANIDYYLHDAHTICPVCGGMISGLSYDRDELVEIVFLDGTSMRYHQQCGKGGGS